MKVLQTGLCSVAFLFITLPFTLSNDLSPSFDNNEISGRSFRTTRVITNIVLLTSTTAMAGSTYCYKIVNSAFIFTTTATTFAAQTLITNTVVAAPNCRKRRWAMENPVEGILEGINSSPVGSGYFEDVSIVERNFEPYLDDEEKTDHFIIERPSERLFNLVQTTTITLTAVTTSLSTIFTKTLIATCTPANIGINQC
ncbi:uncharacterized protein LOC136032825 [Artemia franciscana]|uniref:uncharacterized protein LOC136032825 n=1 Tax=Artemia franciscana TaxID=6661 RepID=UPI0032DB25AC